LETSRTTEEDPGKRLNRELIEMLNELRVALPGVQVLLAFLLTIPFTQRFAILDEWDRRVYFGAVLASALASTCLMAPSAHHRMRFRRQAKEEIIRVANGCAIAGLVLIALAVGASVYLVAAVLHGNRAAAAIGGAFAATTLLFWFAVPLLFGRGEPE
jgi:hypothetical protein